MRILLGTWAKGSDICVQKYSGIMIIYNLFGHIKNGNIMEIKNNYLLGLVVVLINNIAYLHFMVSVCDVTMDSMHILSVCVFWNGSWILSASPKSWVDLFVSMVYVSMFLKINQRMIMCTAKNSGKGVCPFLENEDFFLGVSIFFLKSANYSPIWEKRMLILGKEVLIFEKDTDFFLGIFCSVYYSHQLFWLSVDRALKWTIK